MTMKRCKAIAWIVAAATAVTLLTGCSADPTKYEILNDEGYTVSVRYDANGGEFTAGTSVIVDSFDVSKAPKDGEGNAALSLLDPMHPSRLGTDKSTPKDGCFLVGWYRQCDKSVDENGNEVITYGERWDFEKDVLTVDPDGSYSADEPVLTLYAAWAPKFEIEVRERGTEYVQRGDFNPNEITELKTPAWNEETGELDMFAVPKRDGYTLKTLYLDPEGKQPVTAQTFAHPGVIDYETATVQNPLLTLYADYEVGEWYRIHTVDQLKDNIGINNSYEIMADLDFTDESWPTAFLQGNYNGTIRGNGHTIKNVTFEQNNFEKTGYGLFGSLADGAVVENITFDNVCFTVKKGVKLVDTCIGLFAGRISADATVKNVAVTNSTLQIATSFYCGTTEYSMGTVCGSGDATLIRPAQIAVEVVGENPDELKVTVEGNSVTVGD